MEKSMSDTAIARSFGQFLAEVEDGDLHADLSTTLRDLVAGLHDAAVAGNGRAAGRLTLTLDFKTDGGAIDVASDIATKLPKAKRSRSVFWATPENNLTRRNPRQADLPFRDVNNKAEDFRTVS
jgi:hypothetical protein